MEYKTKKKENASIIPSMIRLLKKEWKDDPWLFLSNAIYTLFETIYPFLIVILPKLLIDELTKGSSANISLIITIVVGFFLISATLGAIKTYLHTVVGNRLSNLRIDYIYILCAKLLTMDYKYIEDAKFWEENENGLEATNSDNNGIELCYKKMYELSPLVLTVIFLAVFIGFLSPYVLLILTGSVIVSIFVSRASSLYRYKLREEYNHMDRKRNYYDRTTYDFSFGKDIRIYDLKDRIIKNYDDEIINVVAVLKKFANKEYKLAFFDLLMLLLSDGIIYFVLISRVLNGMSIADFSMWLMAAVTLSTTMRILSENLSDIIREGRYVVSFFEFVDKDLGEKGGERKKIEGETLEIELKDISFKYPNTDNWIFKNINLKVNKGEKLAVVGINGAGKTTLVKLITGLLEPTSGKILINGIDQKEFSKEALFSMFSVVFQDVNIFAFTVAENIAVKGDMDRERMLSALKRVGLDKKIESFDKGLDQMLLKIIDENGTELSGGESQKLAIARALYEDGNMVILDEPTAALDALAEAEIYKNFDDLVSNKTAIYISHRLASTKFCDHIVFFDGDGLKEYGTHEELMEKRGEYFNMFSVQGKYYQEDAIL